MTQQKPLEGKVGLVTGASRGIGAAIARRLASDGATVVISYNKSAEKATQVINDIKAGGGNGVAVQADHANRADIEKLITTAVEQFGSIDILVNNAAMFAVGAIDDPARDYDLFDQQLLINVGSTAATVALASHHMNDGGRIITIGSISAQLAPWPGRADFSASKAALVAYTKGWARDLGSRGINVTLVQPGPIATDMNPADGPKAPERRAITVKNRYGKPEEIAGAVAFLAGPDAEYITGAVLNVDGGFAL